MEGDPEKDVKVLIDQKGFNHARCSKTQRQGNADPYSRATPCDWTQS